MELLNNGLLKAHIKACDQASMAEGVQDAGMEFDACLNRIAKLLGDEHSELILAVEAAMNNYSFTDSYEIYKIGVSDGMQLQQEINGLGGRK
ncbi:hypothetical protein LOZ80_25945 [Paenibacillus sp. HWE-109]|uniref:hypothetical protein n=1 Tax=Paenibacillus sp. HWE-109 TaxID=1306526 RepID=UPI001EDFF0EE|nr:hypothetical protein [Paenibacillus sp. HWE-109]UKS25023.1 hypothetical protein LOZ80_25945 [Paenibacillus sp. HWE-109]